MVLLMHPWLWVVWHHWEVISQALSPKTSGDNVASHCTCLHSLSFDGSWGWSISKISNIDIIISANIDIFQQKMRVASHCTLLHSLSFDRRYIGLDVIQSYMYEYRYFCWYLYFSKLYFLNQRPTICGFWEQLFHNPDTSKI